MGKNENMFNNIRLLHEKPGTHSIFSPDGNLILISHYKDKTTYIYDKKGTFIKKIRGSNPNFSPDGSLILTYDLDKRLTLIHDKKGNFISTILEINPIFSPDNNFIVTSNHQHTYINDTEGKYINIILGTNPTFFLDKFLLVSKKRKTLIYDMKGKKLCKKICGVNPKASNNTITTNILTTWNDKILYKTYIHDENGTNITLPGADPIIISSNGNFILACTYLVDLYNKKGELITPTAAAILTALGKQINKNLNFSMRNKGIGFGTREYNFQCYTRAFLVDTDNPKEEEIIQLECNIDDMNQQIYPDIIERLLKAGALDAFFTNISMKKGRPGILITVFANDENIDSIKNIIYHHTTTLGLRTFRIFREKLHRSFDTVNIYGNNVKIKVGYFNDKIINIQPEFEDCKIVSREKNIPLKEVIKDAINKYLNNRLIG